MRKRREVKHTSMGKVLRIKHLGRPARGPANQTFFNRGELNQLLSIYSSRVMSGEWRDYAIDQQAGMATFSIYRHSHERPLYTVAKRRSRNGKQDEYLVCRDREKLIRAGSLGEALSVFRPSFRVIS